MKSSRGRKLLLAAAIGMAACSGQESAVVKPAGDGQPPAAVVAIRQPQNSLLRRKVVSHLERKKYRQALDLMNGTNREGLEREYVLAVNGLLGAGNDAFASGDYAAAARAFKEALTAYPPEPSLRHRISRDQKQIRACMEACVNRMMEQGLEEYRRGRLESAIRKWKALLAINPGHREAKKALDTATVQLQSLQNLKSM